jgi:hypothetical protein
MNRLVKLKLFYPTTDMKILIILLEHRLTNHKNRKTIQLKIIIKSKNMYLKISPNLLCIILNRLG